VSVGIVDRMVTRMLRPFGSKGELGARASP